jgi:ubiquitin carboxyl-terminal hydrolase 8
MSSELSDKLKQFIANVRDPSFVSQQIDALCDNIPARGWGVTGLENLGNSCYLNAIIQCLRHTSQLTDALQMSQQQRLLSKNFTNHTINGPTAMVLVNYIKISNLLWGQDTPKISPIGFKILLGESNEQFANNQQHDAHELLVTLLQLFHDTLSKTVGYRVTGTITSELDTQIKKAHDDWVVYYKNKHSVILDIFSGQLRTELVCLNCQRPTYVFDPIMVFDLSLPSVDSSQIISLEQCFNNFIMTEQLSEDNLYSCNFCHARTCAHKTMSIWSLPKILIIKLNRFQQQFSNGVYQSRKINTGVTYPLMGFNVSPYISLPVVGETLYDLYAVTCHMGNMEGGHYYSICFNHSTNSWINCNDGRCVPCNNPISEHAYILYYKLRKN